jgi:hypothetical protein
MGICNSVKKPTNALTTTERPLKETEPAAVVRRNKISSKSIYDGNTT